MNQAETLEKFEEKFTPGADATFRKTEFRSEVTYSFPVDRLRAVASYCKNVLDYDYLVDISSVDHFGQEPRYELVYELYTMAGNHRLRLKTMVSEDDMEAAPTVSDLWPTANWHEREIFDMMGVRFAAHPDLRRILMWDGYPYFPLRKDFPLEGKTSDVPDVAFTNPAPLGGGPFVTPPSNANAKDREPRARRPAAESETTTQPGSIGGDPGSSGASS